MSDLKTSRPSTRMSSLCTRMCSHCTRMCSLTDLCQSQVLPDQGRQRTCRTSQTLECVRIVLECVLIVLECVLSSLTRPRAPTHLPHRAITSSIRSAVFFFVFAHEHMNVCTCHSRTLPSSCGCAVAFGRVCRV